MQAYNNPIRKSKLTIGLILITIAWTAEITLKSQAQTVSESIQVIQQVHVVDVESGNLLRNQQVVIRNQKIESIEPMDAAAAPQDGTTIIDAEGRHLIPGLFDAHVHLVSDLELFAPMLVAHGVTSVRDLGGPTDMIMAYKRSAPNREEPTPDITACGAIIDGTPPVWPFSEACETEEEAIAAVRKLAAAGVDQIKVYSLLKKEVYLAAVAEAKRIGLPVTGHVPMSVSIEEAVEAGQMGIEHLDGFASLFNRMVNDQKEIDDPTHLAASEAIEGWALWPQIDRNELKAILKQHADHRVVHIPTLTVMASMGRLADPKDDPANDPRIKYISPSTLSFWQDGRYESYSPRARQAVPAMTELVSELYRHGVTLAIGTDLANPYVFPGSSVHEEMERYVLAGIPAAEVIKMATVNSAKLCGVFDDRGSITKGKTASLVLLDENPLVNINAIRQIRGVWLRGRYLDRKALDDLLNSVETRAKGAAPIADPTAPPDMPGEVVRQGTYDLKFGLFPAGSESFVVTRSEDGYHTWAHSKPQGGGQVPAVIEAQYGLQGELKSASYKSLGNEKAQASYRISDGHLIGTAKLGDGSSEEAQHPLQSEFRISLPVYANEFMFYRNLGLEVGESTEIQSAGFGDGDWKPESVMMQIRRGEDESIEVDGQTWQTQVYHSTFTGPIGEMKFQTWCETDGHAVKSVLKFSFGTVTATRRLER